MNLRLLKVLLGLLALSLLLGWPVGRASAMAATVVRPAAGSTLGVARAGGAILYDEAGQRVRDLSAGAALKVTARSADSRWVYGALKDGAAGWVEAARLVIFSVGYLPARADFTGPAADRAAAPAPVAARAVSDQLARVPATVVSGTERLNVRAGPATSFPIIATLAPGAAVATLARDTAAAWVQIEQGAGTGWVSAQFVAFQGRAAASLPVAAQIPAPPAPAASPTPGLTGRLVFQERSGGKIYVYDFASAALRILTTGADPALSPDGRTVAFWRGGAENGIYLIGVDGANEREILRRGEQVRAPSWSPDGAQIVFSHVNGEDRCRDAGYGVCLPDRPPYSFLFPLIKTDRWGLARINRAGGDYRDVPTVANARTPAWSDRGIFYTGAGIQVTQDATEQSQNQLVLGEARYQDPAVQPGGGRLVFASLEKDHWEIFSAGTDGANVIALTRPETTLVSPLPHNVAPAWSPDGASIVFLSNRTDSVMTPGPGPWRLWVMNADGSNKRPLPIDALIEYNGGEQVVSWGPR